MFGGNLEKWGNLGSVHGGAWGGVGHRTFF